MEGYSKYQIGAIPKHQSQEPLFTLKSVMSWYEILKIALIMQLFHISKFCDREHCQDGMNTLYNFGIHGKLYRLNYEHNRKTVLKVKTVTEARQIFLKKSSMSRYVKFNFMSEARYVKDMWLCDSCQTSIDSMDHVVWCLSYRELRKDKNMNSDKDMAKYLHKVMLIRSKLDLQK